jgi:DNA polymerase-3 subunit alpha
MYMMERIKAHGRWIDTPEYKKRFQTEIDVIMNNKILSFIPYFLLYEDISQHARSVGVFMGEGRGSAGGSLVSYYLKIIHIDPVKAKLPFERFLSHPRIEGLSFPDIDGDFSDRVPIIKFLHEKYGLGFAQVVTLQTMKVKNAIKDAMWALYARNRNDPEIGAVCNTIPDSPPGGGEYAFLYGFTDREGVEHKGHVEENEMLGNFFKHYPEIEKMVKKLIGSVRGYGRHASAYVVSTLDLSKQRVPTMIMDHDELGQITVTQFAAGDVEDAGLIKADILRVANLEMVKQAMGLIKDRTGKDYMLEDSEGMAEIYRLPDDDGVYKDFYRKKTDSVFQFHTEINKAHVQDFRPTSREHLAAMTALLRPGAMDALVVNEDLSEEDGISATQYYLDVRSGRRKVAYVHPDLASCTSNGVFVYQEEVMEFLVWAGFTMAEADQYRAAIAKKKLEKMQSAFEKIRITCTERGWTSTQIQTVCNQIQAFARYSFNRSHSRCYGDLGYITMYLKHHHPLEWWCSVLNVTDKEDKRRGFVALLGDMIKPPSMKFPSNQFDIRGDYVVSPINVIKKVGPSTADEMMAKGPFEDLRDFCLRINHAKVNIGHVSAMIRARAADDLMDGGILLLNYGAAREDFMERYLKARTTKSKFKDDMHDYSPVKVFLDEREYNQCFNKSLFSDKEVKKIILESDEAFEKTGNVGVPLFRRGKPVLGDLKVAAGMVANKVDREVGMVLLYQSSLVKKGVSKRTGKPYEFVTITLSDGYATVECVDWYNKTAKGWPKDSLVYVSGHLKEGWRNPVSIQLKSIRQLAKEIK